jgi:predicted transcriptional regulator/transcriptional regulator with XRE-family HTH domain
MWSCERVKLNSAKASRRKLFFGGRVRTLRQRLGLTQQSMAARVGISVSYLSQIESDDRPMTEAVLAAFARSFPMDWADIEEGEEAALLARLSLAANDATVSGPEISGEQLHRAAERFPLLAQRMTALHAAYQRSQEQLTILNDALDQSGSVAAALPWNEVRDWFHAEGNYVDRLDRAAEVIATDVVEPVAGAIEDRLLMRHKVKVARDAALPGAVLRHFDRVARLLVIDRSVPAESQLFLMAHQLMRLELAEPIDAVARSSDLRTDSARELLSIGLSNYAAGAFLMPYERFRSEARRLRHDVDALRQGFGVSFEQVCHRLSTLQRPGAGGVPMFFCRVDLAGNITKRHSATRLQFARFGGACPMWVVHEAAAIPDRVWVQLAETPDGVRYIAIAKGLVKPSTSYTRPSRRFAVTLGCEVGYAQEFIYADGLDIDGPRTATPIGISCRICPRTDCEQRAFPQIGRELVFDPDFRTVVPYQIR